MTAPRWLARLDPERERARRAAEDRALVAASGLFDPAFYLSRHPEAADDPLGHFLDIGGPQGAAPSAHFDADWYLATNPDPHPSRRNPLVHYLRRGEWLGLQPQRGFAPDAVAALARDQAMVVGEEETGTAQALAGLSGRADTLPSHSSTRGGAFVTAWCTFVGQLAVPPARLIVGERLPASLPACARLAGLEPGAATSPGLLVLDLVVGGRRNRANALARLPQASPIVLERLALSERFEFAELAVRALEIRQVILIDSPATRTLWQHHLQTPPSITAGVTIVRPGAWVRMRRDGIEAWEIVRRWLGLTV